VIPGGSRFCTQEAIAKISNPAGQYMALRRRGIFDTYRSGKCAVDGPTPPSLAAGRTGPMQRVLGATVREQLTT
ncbi:MAG: hypothetical protein M0Z94_13035, partial [Dehalococcoidales bacterium]|nr:hypothetical protein [Dehalococcoidales bacterium]